MRFLATLCKFDHVHIKMHACTELSFRCVKKERQLLFDISWKDQILTIMIGHANKDTKKTSDYCWN